MVIVWTYGAIDQAQFFTTPQMIWNWSGVAGADAVVSGGPYRPTYRARRR